MDYSTQIEFIQNVSAMKIWKVSIPFPCPWVVLYWLDNRLQQPAELHITCMDLLHRTAQGKPVSAPSLFSRHPQPVQQAISFYDTVMVLKWCSSFRQGMCHRFWLKWFWHLIYKTTLTSSRVVESKNILRE